MDKIRFEKFNLSILESKIRFLVFDFLDFSFGLLEFSFLIIKISIAH